MSYPLRVDFLLKIVNSHEIFEYIIAIKYVNSHYKSPVIFLGNINLPSSTKLTFVLTDVMPTALRTVKQHQHL